MDDTLSTALSVQRIPATDIVPLLERSPTLCTRMAYPTYFCTASWLDVVLRHSNLAHCCGLIVLAGHESIGVLPLESIRNRLGGDNLRYLGHRLHPDPLGLICNAADLPRAIAAIQLHLSTMQGWDQLILDNLLPEESKLWAGWRESQSVAPYIPLSCTFEEFLSRFPGKKRYKLRSKIAKARASGIDFHIARSPQEKALFIQALFDLHNRRSAAIARKSSIKGEYVEKFHHDLVTSTAQACLYALKKGDRFVAVLYGFQERDRFHFYQIAHDPEYDSLRPGTVILAFAVELACDSGLIEFNFLQGDEPYKFEWTTTVRHLTRVEFVSPRLKPKAVALARRSARFAKRIFR